MQDQIIELAKAGRLSLIMENGNVTITDNWLTDRIVFYEHKPAWACAGLFFVRKQDCPRAIRNKIDQLAGVACNATMERYGTMLRVYDNNGKTFDRYTILPPKHAKEYREKSGLWAAIGASENPFYARGFGMFVTADPGPHLGKRIAWGELPQDVKRFARESFPEYAPIAI